MLTWLGAIFMSILLCRIVYIILKRGEPKSLMYADNIKLMAIAGSGGHTTELIRLLTGLPNKITPRDYVIAVTDHISEKKLINFEHKRKAKLGHDYFISKIPRSREVSQSWISTVYTTAIASLYSIPLLWRSKPNVILCNGPGTCIPICVTSILFKIIGLCWTDIIFVESLCRVTTMSMSGRILYPLADKFYVQWSTLLEQYPKSTYLGGRIV